MTDGRDVPVPGFRTADNIRHTARGDQKLTRPVLDALVGAHTSGDDCGILLRCPCHREPLAPFYLDGEIALLCVHDGTPCGVVVVADAERAT